jgi:ABC-type nitrate/sulfonate/bicarbonate transport system ATPase subunit
MPDKHKGDAHLHRVDKGLTGEPAPPKPAEGPSAGVPPQMKAPAEARKHPNEIPPTGVPASAPAISVVPVEAPPQPRHFHIPHVHEPEYYPDDPDPTHWKVTFENVVKRFGDGPKAFTAVRNVNFRVYDIPNVGEFICVLGPSGCGKSTILNMIAGFYGPSEGQVLVRGKPVQGPGADRGMVFQSYSSFPNLTVWENVAFGLVCQELRRPRNPVYTLFDPLLGIRGARRRRIRDEAMAWVQKVNLTGNENKYPHQLSGGMRQRVAIARTLALKPDIILMDEPFGALDRVTRWEMQDLLIHIWHEVQATVFLITHDLDEAVFLGDRIYIMSESPGTILEETALPRPDESAAEMQRKPEFGEIVREISAKVERGYLEHKIGKK